MLKITQIAEDNTSVTIKLEGRIVGQWVNELKKECRKYMRRRNVLILDLSGATFADDRGIKMLSAMAGNQVRLTRCSLLLSGLLENVDGPML